MGNVYVKMSEDEIRKIQEALIQNAQLDNSNLVCKLELLLTEMQPGTTLTLEAVQKPKKRQTG